MRYRGIKGKAWNAVKTYTRSKYKNCYTCPAKGLIGSNAHTGHYQPVAIVGSNNNLAWDGDFIRLQCGRCNGVGEGMQNVFRRKLVTEHGEKKVAEFDRQVEGKVVNPVKSWEEITERYKKL